MARQYEKIDLERVLTVKRRNVLTICRSVPLSAIFLLFFPITNKLSVGVLLLLIGIVPAVAIFILTATVTKHLWLEKERRKESAARNDAPVIGLPPDRKAFADGIASAKDRGKLMIDKYLVGFEVDSGDPIWVTDEELCSHACVFAKTGVGKTLWVEGLMFQQMARGRASGLTFIDAKRDPGTLADIILMALITGRIEDLIVVDPFNPVCSYNFVFTTQREDVKARKVLRCGLPPTSDASTTKHYDRLAADAVYRVVKAMESFGLAWSVKDIAVALSAFTVAYPRMRALLHERGAKDAMIELGHLANSYRNAKGGLDSARLTDNLRGIASELHSIANSEAGEMFCAPRADLSLTDAIRRGKIIYYMLPRLEEAESAARMVKVFREDLEVSIGEITSSRGYRLEDPHMVIIDEGASTFGPTWANLFELARKGRFALIFGAQSIGGLMDTTMGLSQQFYERVIANVNLKVIMRLGDNKTALDMAEWFGKISTQKKSISTGASIGISARELTKSLELNRRSSDSIKDGITLADDEEDLVSPEELKHEMSAEKGLAWFDTGDGILRKGRSIWFDNNIPSSWEGREYLVHYEAIEADEIGLAEWVDEHILSLERAETEKDTNKIEENPFTIAGHKELNGNNGNSVDASNAQANVGEPMSFRFDANRGFKGAGKSNIAFITTISEEEPKLESEDIAKVKNVAKAATPVKSEETTNPPSPPAPPKKKGLLAFRKK
ncbi:MAG: TraM recognition domain-containing protein [Deltaproteobacteria bacterium]|jgi:hypothetical protein|nr:TraM recognition domain-containing protein [Deltaproteobacteria bacterium]